MEPGSILDATQLSFAGDFDDQILEILTQVRLTRAEVESLQCLIDDLQHALCRIWPECQVYPFGSIVTGLGIKTSDIDCFIELPEGLVHKKEVPVFHARNVLRTCPAKFTQLFAITSAKIPILKFVHRPTGFNCDINFSSLNGVRNSKLIAFLLQMDTRALRLAIIIKYWSKVYNVTGTNLMPNYALTMMVIFYLQVKYILPSVAELQRHQRPVYVELWNTAFNDRFVYTSENTESLYELLGGFFNYYKDFEYTQHVISPFLGYPLKKQSFSDVTTLPSEFFLYKEYVSNDTCSAIRLEALMCVQDPFEHSRNCSVAVFGKLFSRIYDHVVFAANLFNVKEKNLFLKELLTLDTRKGPEAATSSKQNSNNKIKKRKQKKLSKGKAREYYKQYYTFTGWRGSMKPDHLNK